MAISWDDFDKIWASTSPLTPYNFSEVNYKQGWNFVGATPPARQMWDSIQKKNDEKFKYLRDNFGTPNIVTSSSQMTDTDKVYVYMGSEAGWNSGHWYYYDEGTSSWADGGVYNSVAFVTDTTLSIAGQPADAKAVGDAIALKPNVDPTLTISGAAADAKVTGNLIEDGFGLVDINELVYTSTESKAYNTNGTISDSTTYSITSLIDVSDYEKIKIQANNLAIYLFTFESNGTTVHSYNGWYTEYEYTKPSSVKYIALTVRHPQGQTQVSPTTDEIADNIRFVAIKHSIPVVDTTLAISGDAADAKAVGDEFVLQSAEVDTIQSIIKLDKKTLSVTEGKAYGLNGTISDSAAYSIIDKIPLTTGRKTVKFTTNGYRIYYCVFNSIDSVIKTDGWYTDTTLHLNNNAVAIACTIRRPSGQTQTSPTTAEILKNIKVYEIAETNLAERIKYLPSPLFPVAKSTRYVYSKGKMWEYNWNTAEAFTAAGKDDRCWGISADVRVTSDGYFVCFHDATVDAQTDGTGAIEDKTWAQVQEINVDKGVWDGSSWTGQSDGRTCKIPLLSDFLKICRKYGKVALIETKAAGSTAIGNLSSANIDDIVAMIRNMGMENSCAFIVPKSNYTYLYNNYRQLCRFKLYDGDLTASEINTYAYDYNIVFGAWNSALTESLIGLAHQNRLYIAGYTPRTNPATDDEEMVEKGLDVVFLFREPPEI